MTRQTVTREYLTPPEAARMLGVRPFKILTWIRSGELRASNTATCLAGDQPRYRIRRCDFEDFLAARVPDSRPARPRRNTAYTSTR